MEVFEQIITSFAIVGLVLATLISYLKVNKIWVRKHVKEVSESVSVVAAFLSLFTTMPFLVKALLIDQDYVTAGKWFISLVVFFVMVSIGIGVWARKGERLGFWKMLKQSLLTERGELTYLIQSFTKPKEAESILRILQLVSAVDHNLDEKELQIIESVAKPWGIQPKEIVGARRTPTCVPARRGARRCTPCSEGHFHKRFDTRWVPNGTGQSNRSRPPGDLFQLQW